MSEITSCDRLPIRDPSYICSGGSELSAGLDDSVCYDDWWGPVEHIKEPKNRERISSKEEPLKASQHEGASTKHTGPPSFDDARKFLERIRLWDSAEHTGIHWTIPGNDGRRSFWRGVPVRSVEDALRQLAWITRQPTTRDIYIALGTQRDTETEVTKEGKSFAVAWRAKENTVSFRTLFIDLDVKPGAYDTRKDAVDALKKFIVDAGLPAFSMVVASGTGGLHVYWVLDRDIPADEWHQLGLALANAVLQSGLKFDSQCSYDYTRVLRIPNTFNYKRGEPLPVKLLFCDNEDIAVERMAAALEPYKGLKLAVAKKSDATASANNPLLMGLERQAQPRNIDEVAKDCGWVRESLETGGADNNNALRLLIYKMSTVCEDGDDTAWRMMSERETLTEDEFERELERAKNDVQRNPKLAWPDCTTVAANGAKACQSCRYKDAGCKPLNLPPVLMEQPRVVPIIKNNTIPEVEVLFNDKGEPIWELNRGKLAKSYKNALIALRILNPAIAYNSFMSMLVIENNPTSDFVMDKSVCGPVTDRTLSELRLNILSRFNVDPGKEHIAAAIETLAYKNQFNPVTEYLNRLVYHEEVSDKALDTWTVQCLGVEDTPLNRAFGRFFIIAAAMRAFYPGSKFDVLLVLDTTTQGSGKSTIGIKLTGGVGSEYFSEVDLFSTDQRVIVEQLQGVWIGEVGEMGGYSRREVSHSKRVISASKDKARVAYARFAETFLRMGVYYATANETEYLSDMTGNRRIWPLRCGVTGPINLNLLGELRDELFAGAVRYLQKVVAKGRAMGLAIEEGRPLPVELYSHFTLPEGLRGAAAEATEARRAVTRLKDVLDELLDASMAGKATGGGYVLAVQKDNYGKILIKSKDLNDLLSKIIGKDVYSNTVASLMAARGWDKPDKLTIDGKQCRGFRK